MAMILPLKSGDQIIVSGQTSNPNSIEVKGSADAERMVEFNRFLGKAMEAQQELNVKFQQYADHPEKDSILNVFQKRYKNIETEIEDKIKTMIDQDATLFSNLALMEQLSPDNAENISYFKKVEKALADQYSESPFYKNFKAKVADAGRFAPGTEVPEINLPNPKGEMVPLSSLRGQVVLIDFWASWCKPCRRENPNVVEAYQKYKDQGFTVYGVSLDRTKEAWVKAIKDDNLTWTHVSDLKFWQSEAAQTYGVKGIPFALLIDEEGRVIGKNLRGQALHNKLAEVLK
jgi:peroxiredoxin